MALSIQPYKGARDFYPQDKRVQKYMFKVWRQVAEQFGYEEYDSPILEPTELYVSKTSEEVVNEQTYTFTDRGGRTVTIRPEMTPSVSRMVAGRRQELAYPVRWYSIPNFWRYERPQRGRLREFWQLNVDVFGLEGLEAEHENILLADSIMKAFGANEKMYTIKLNSRKLVDSYLKDVLGVDETQAQSLVRLIDKMHKVDYSEFVGQLDSVFSPSQREEGRCDDLLVFLKAKTVDDLPDSVLEHLSVNELRQLIKLLDNAEIDNVEFDPTLMRGFDYYTDIVFEVFDNHPENNRSMFGGGRYDGLVGLFDVEPVPSVGFGMGDVTLQNFLEVHGLMPKLGSEVELYVVLIGEVYAKSQSAIAQLREMGLNVYVDSSGRKPEKQLRNAIKNDIPYALFIGERELEENQFTLKDLRAEEEERHGLQRIVSIVKDYRSE